MQLEVKAAMPVGQTIPVSLHIDITNFPVLECKARVAWCKPESRACWRVGLEFVEASLSTQAHLDRYQQFLAARSQMSGDGSCGGLWGSEDQVMGTKSRRLVHGHWTED